MENITENKAIAEMEKELVLFLALEELRANLRLGNGVRIPTRLINASIELLDSFYKKLEKESMEEN
jgi:hypothetical protein